MTPHHHCYNNNHLYTLLYLSDFQETLACLTWIQVDKTIQACTVHLVLLGLAWNRPFQEDTAGTWKHPRYLKHHCTFQEDKDTEWQIWYSWGSSDLGEKRQASKRSVHAGKSLRRTSQPVHTEFSSSVSEEDWSQATTVGPSCNLSQLDDIFVTSAA